jgi:hypothetical protein
MTRVTRRDPRRQHAADRARDPEETIWLDRARRGDRRERLTIGRSGGSSSVHGRLGRTPVRVRDAGPLERRASAPIVWDERSTERPIRSDERSPAMTAQTQTFDADLLGAFPALLLVLVIVLTLLGVVAHVAFA